MVANIAVSKNGKNCKAKQREKLDSIIWIAILSWECMILLSTSAASLQHRIYFFIIAWSLRSRARYDDLSISDNFTVEG